MLSSLKRPLVVLSTLSVLALAAGCSDDEPTTATDPEPTEASTPASEPTGPTCDYPADAGGAAKDVDPPPAQAVATGDVEITISTSVGDIGATLGADLTPCTVNSFISLAEQGYFDDTPCHRLTTEGIFVLQCGDPSGTGSGGPGYSFDDELSGTETYGAGTLAMANAGPNTNGSQFFIVYGDSGLPPSYNVFGSVDEAGLTLVQKVGRAGVQGGGPDGPPATAVDLQSVTVS